MTTVLIGALVVAGIVGFVELYYLDRVSGLLAAGIVVVIWPPLFPAFTLGIAMLLTADYLFDRD